MKGFNFVPTPLSISKTPILRAATEFGRKIKLNYIFKNPKQTFVFDNRTWDTFTNKSNWDAPNKMIPETILAQINQMENEIKELAITKEKANCPPEEIKALKNLRRNPNIIINSRSCTYTLFQTQGVEIELIFALRAAVSEIRANFQNCPIWA